MNELLKIILSLSLSGSILILALLLLRPLCRNRMSWRWQYYIWLLVIARLLLPLTPDTSVTGNLFRQAENHIVQTAASGDAAGTGYTAQADNTADTERSAQSGDVTETERPIQSDDATETGHSTQSDNATETKRPAQSGDATGTGQPAQADAATGNTAPSADAVGSSLTATDKTERTDSIDKPSATPAVRISGNILSTLCAVWLVIALLLFVRKVTIYQSFVKYVNAGSSPVDDIDLLERFGQIIAGQHIRGTIDLRVNSLVSSPLLIGFYHARIVLPTVDLPADDFYYSILHELTHYRRKDMFYKWLVQLTVCLHWFNPFVYLMGHEINRLCELSCDERVIRSLPEISRKLYGDTLLNSLTADGSYRDTLASLTLNESKELLKGRLEAIMKYRKKTRLILTATLCITAMLICATVSMGAYMPASSRNYSPSPADALLSLPEIPSLSAAGGTKPLPDLPDAPGAGSFPGFDDESGYYIYTNGDKGYDIFFRKNRYSILIDGTNTSCIPTGSITDGCFGIYLIQKDEYMSLGPFSGSDAAAITAEIKESYDSAASDNRLVLDHKEILDDAIPRIVSHILDSEQAPENTNAVFYNYVQQFHYQKPYIVGLGYNVPSGTWHLYNNTSVTLSDHSSITVYFNAECEKYIQDKTAIDTITALLDRIVPQRAETTRPIKDPLIVNMEYVGDADLYSLAEKYYSEPDEDLAYFSALFPELDSRTQQQYLERMFEDDEISFFMCCIGLLKDTETYNELVEHYLLKAYEQDNNSFFSALAPMLDAASRKRWLEKCEEESNNTFYYYLLQNLQDDEDMIWGDSWSKDFFDQGEPYEDLYDEDFEEASPIELLEDWLDTAEYEEHDINDYQDEYNEQSIVIIKNACYYQNARVRILMDVRADGSFENFAYNKRGTVDLRLIRDNNGRIIHVEYLTAEESAEILEEIDFYPVSDENDKHNDTTNIIDLNRLTKQEISDTLLNTLDSCETGKWYLIDDDGRQYIYYNGLPHSYAYEPWINGSETGDLITVEIADININSPLLRSDEALSHYVLLAFSYTPHDPEAAFSLTLKYNNVPVTYESISTAAP